MTTEASAPRKHSKFSTILVAVTIAAGLLVAFALLLGQLIIMSLSTYGQVQEHTSGKSSESTQQAFATYAEERYSLELTQAQLEGLAVPDTFTKDFAPADATVYGSIFLLQDDERELLTLVYDEGAYRLLASGALSELPLQ